MRITKITCFLLIASCLLFSACKKDEEAGANNSDPYSLEEGTIVFELDGVTVTTIEGTAGRDDETSVGIGALWTEFDSINVDLIIRTFGISVFAVNPIQEKDYTLVWSDCSGNPGEVEACGFFMFNTDESGISGNYRSQSSDTFLKVDLKELGTEIGDKVVGTFEAKVSSIGDSNGERYEVMNGAFNLVIQ